MPRRGIFPPGGASAASGAASRLRMNVTMHPRALHHMIISSLQPHADVLLATEAEQLIERHIRRDIQYRLILRQNTVHLCTSRQPAYGHPEGSVRLWRTSMEQENGNVKYAPGPRPKQ